MNNALRITYYGVGVLEVAAIYKTREGAEELIVALAIAKALLLAPAEVEGPATAATQEASTK